GLVLILEIGATNVGSIVQTYEPGPVEKGEEKGYFEFGGSMTIAFFEPGRIQLADDLNAERELYAKMGDRLGTIQSDAAA
ncbi:MAG: phosphatidylserine decarboxylase, partial [Verrucomicrobiales bacterium]|nr:phosphatidylserine decarboxylase [Verrucomicrobiales bacterium]